MVEIMIFKKLYIALLLTFCAVHFSTTAQVRPRVDGLEVDTTYMSLLAEEMKLRTQEDSLVKTVTSLREKLRTDRNNIQSNSQNILKLEGEIFEVRNKIGRIASQTSAIEQDFILKNLGGVTNQTTDQSHKLQNSGNVSAYLTANPFFKQNMPAEDYAALTLAGEKEKPLASYIRIFAHNYNLLSKIADEYAKADSVVVADSLWQNYIEQKRLLSAISDSVATLNDYIFDTKSYSYNLLLDKLNKTQLIKEFGDKNSQARSAEAQLNNKSEAVAVSAYPIRKRLTLDYETTLARILGLDMALDSLEIIQAELDTLMSDYPPIMLNEKLFIDYEPITIHSPARYNTTNPIPELVIYEKGTIYRILLGSFTREQPVSIFRGAYPLGVWRSEDGKYNYYAGGFATREEAEAALEQMKEVGFKAPKIALWDYGDYSLPDETQLSQDRESTDAAVLRIEISGVKGDLNDAVKEAIKEAAPGKDIIRMGDLFTVGTFSGEGEAERVASAIRAADPILEVKVTGQTE